MNMHRTQVKISPSPELSLVGNNLAPNPSSPFRGFEMPSPGEMLIEAGSTERRYWRDTWRYRELLYFLAWRDLLVRYKQTFVGVSWSLIRPLLSMVVLTVVFGKLGKMPSHGMPYPLLVLCGMLPWLFFSTAISEGGNSLVTNTNLISKVYFPRVIIVFSSVITSFVDFLISGAFLLILMVWYHHAPPTAVLFLPIFVLLVSVASLGAGLWIAALMVEYRDFRFIVPFIVQFGLYISPVGFQSDVVPERFRLFYAINPMVGIIDGFRWCLLGEQNNIYLPAIVIAFLEVIGLFASGVWYFRKTEQSFADVI
jgi:homopolymeric O-antigen transport system permease protein